MLQWYIKFIIFISYFINFIQVDPQGQQLCSLPEKLKKTPFLIAKIFYNNYA